MRNVLAGSWLAKPETAKRLRQSIRTVIDWSVAKGYRETSLAMPKIDKALPKQRAKAKHRAALAHEDATKFMTDLRSKETVPRLALEALILTALRNGDVRGMKWDEVDVKEGVWRAPCRGRTRRERAQAYRPASLYPKSMTFDKGAPEARPNGTKRQICLQ